MHFVQLFRLQMGIFLEKFSSNINWTDQQWKSLHYVEDEVIY